MVRWRNETERGRVWIKWWVKGEEVRGERRTAYTCDGWCITDTVSKSEDPSQDGGSNHKAFLKLNKT